MTVSPNPPRNASRRSASPWGIALVVVASAVAHGALLGLPWPFESEPFEPSEPILSELEDPSLMDIAVLPRNLLESDNLEATDADEEAELEVTPQQQTTDSEPEPEPSLSQEPEPKLEPEPEPESKPETESETLPTLPGEDDSDPIGGLPEESGLTPGSSTPVKTLDEKLSDRNEYVYSSTGIRKRGAIGTELMSWVAPGQILPEKVDPLEVPYRLTGECLPSAPVAGTLAVILEPDDTPQKDPKIVSSTGYPLLDAKALELVAAHPFPDRTEAKGYSLEVRVVDYPAHCP
ncbi:MAG: hypothetical protein AAGG53_16195 [Cyanobacteria bacterium P01_H01_bin.152]